MRRRALAQVQERARQLRQEQTPAEERLWEALRNRRLDGYKFRRQHPIGRFIVDFFCAEAMLIVEVDGAVHDRQAEYDQLRADVLQQLGYRLLRLRNDQIESHMDAALEEIRRCLFRDTCNHPKPDPDSSTLT